MRHLREIDPQHTVIMVQPENEVGSYGSPRDFSPEANRLFAGPIPAELARKVGSRGTWSEVFGRKADSSFNAWYTARYIDEIAAAGQAELNLPMYRSEKRCVGKTCDRKCRYRWSPDHYKKKKKT